MRIAIVHDWLVAFGGAEKVLEQLLQIWPDADLFAVVDFFSDEDRKRIGGKMATTTFVQDFPRAKRFYRHYLPFMPLAIEQLDLSGYDVILSSSHAVAKGVLTGPNQLHISYVHSPIRYAWDLQHQYLRESGLRTGLKGLVAKMILHKIRVWDYRTSAGVDFFIANSKFIARRIDKVYRRSSQVIYPPVDVMGFSMSEEKEDYYFTASRLVPYKRVDLIVRAFASMPDRKLVVIGDGPEMEKIKGFASSNVEMMGYQSFAVLRKKMQAARAFVFAAEEDFGITPVEAQACGTPVIAYGVGGALETVVSSGQSPTGIFFAEQTVGAVVDAVHQFEARDGEFGAINCRKQAEKFSEESFRSSMKRFVLDKYRDFKIF